MAYLRRLLPKTILIGSGFITGSGTAKYVERDLGRAMMLLAKMMGCKERGGAIFMALIGTVFLLDFSGALFAQENHSQHQVTVEEFAVLRSKIPLYQEFTDEQIIDSMENMGPNCNVYVSDAAVQGDIGILALAHGFNEPGDTQFKEALGPISQTYPTAIGYGMAMMTSEHIQSATNDLIAAGAKTIVLIYTSFTPTNNLVKQWDYIFDRGSESAYLDVSKVTPDVNLVLAPPQSDSLIIADIMLDFVQNMSTDPENELVIVASHGPTRADLNEKELVILEGYADHMREQSDFSDIKVITLQDDAPSAVRAANVTKFRNWAESAAAEGKRVLVVSNLLTTSSVHRKIKRDLEGLDYDFSTTGTMLHPLFQDWIEHAVSEALK
jgi:hypothetical protein